MILVQIKDDITFAKTELGKLGVEVCFLYDKRTKNKFIVLEDKYDNLLNQKFAVIKVDYLNEEIRLKLIMSDDFNFYEVSGYKEFLGL